MSVTVIDAPCGAGKTEWAIAYMNDHPQERFIFVTPFLTEVERVKEGTTEDFFDPQFYHRTDIFGGDAGSKSKLQDFNDLLTVGKNIVTTHATFTSATEDTVRILQDNAYNLIIDEVVDVLLPLNDIVDSTRNRVNRVDADLMLSNGIISVGDDYRVHWTGGSLPIDGTECHTYAEVQRYAENGTLLLIDKKFFLWELPPDLFNAMESVTILTYQIEGSFLYPYLRIHSMDFEKMSVHGVYGQGFELIPYKSDTELRMKWKQLILLYNDKKQTNYGALSATWYKKQVEGHPRSPEAKLIKNGLKRFFTDVHADPSDVMWSCPKSCRRDVAPPGFKITRELTDDEKRGRTQMEQDEYIDKNGLRCWVAANARATNNFSNRHILAYALDLNPNPEITKYFSKMNSPLSRDNFALAGLIQWIWRSAIRKGEPITLYLPSPRMRKLFVDWLDGKR